MTHRILNFNENFLIAELMAASKESNGDLGLAGVVAIEDPTLNKLLQVRKNIITLRGRSFALEKLFNSAPPQDSDYIFNLSREVMMFRIGTGGTPTAQPFNPIPPSPTDSELELPIPFRIEDPNDSDTLLTADEQDIYKDPRPLTGDNEGKIGYFSKRFENFEPATVWNPVDNKVYKHIQLLISNKDARDTYVNELGLVLCNSTFGEMELFSRVTFGTEDMATVTDKSLLVHYFVHA